MKRVPHNLGKARMVCTAGLGFPIVAPIGGLQISEMIPFNLAKATTKSNKGIHFFLDDYQFERVWNDPFKYVSLFKCYAFITSPDFSLFTNMPKVMQMWNKYRSMWLSVFFSNYGIKVVPTIQWSDTDSYDWCFDGLPCYGTIAVSSVGCLKNKKSKELFLKGYSKAIESLNPTQVIFYGKVPREITERGNLVIIEPFQSCFDKKGEC